MSHSLIVLCICAMDGGDKCPAKTLGEYPQSSNHKIDFNWRSILQCRDIYNAILGTAKRQFRNGELKPPTKVDTVTVEDFDEAFRLLGYHSCKGTKNTYCPIEHDL